MTATAQTFQFSRELFNPVYIPLLHDKTEFLHLFGSAGSGKSRFAAQKEIIKSFDSTRRGRKTLAVRKVAKTLKDSVYSELKSVIYEWGVEDCFEILKSPLHITNTRTGVEFLFTGLDDVEKVKSVSGVDRIWIEEATELDTPKEMRQLRLRLRGFDEVQVTLCYNPIDEHHWLNTEIHEMRPEGHRIFKSTYKDNVKMLAVDPTYANYIESLKDEDSNYYRVYGLGEWGSVIEGLIYPKFAIVPEFPQTDDGKDDIHHYGLDFGFSDPCALVAQHVEDALPKKNLINKQVLYETGLDGPNLVRRFGEIGVRKDRNIVADNARPEMIATLRTAGYKVSPCHKATGSVLTGINNVRKYNLQIAAGSKDLIKEFRNYQKNQTPDGIWLEEPAKNQVDHGCDAVRYAEEATHIIPWQQARRSIR